MPALPELCIVIAKRARELALLQGANRRTYPIVLGRNASADKEAEGDEATPLGEFYICAKNPRSRYFLSLCISYPNAEHAARGLSNGLIGAGEHAQILLALQARRMPPQHTRLGGEIYIHGRGDHEDIRGTRGCISLSNAHMRELYDEIELGTAVSIRE